MSRVQACPTCGRKNRLPIAASGRPRCAHCHSDLPWLVDISEDEFPAAVLASHVPVLVDVWAPWCGPCRMVAPVVADIARTFAGRLKVVKLNSDEAPRVSQQHQIRSIPTLLLYDGGQERDRMIGAQPPAALRQWVESHLADARAGDRATAR